MQLIISILEIIHYHTGPISNALRYDREHRHALNTAVDPARTRQYVLVSC
jgi:hypothetical protein